MSASDTDADFLDTYHNGENQPASGHLHENGKDPRPLAGVRIDAAEIAPLFSGI